MCHFSRRRRVVPINAFGIGWTEKKWHLTQQESGMFSQNFCVATLKSCPSASPEEKQFHHITSRWSTFSCWTTWNCDVFHSQISNKGNVNKFNSVETERAMWGVPTQDPMMMHMHAYNVHIHICVSGRRSLENCTSVYLSFSIMDFKTNRATLKKNLSAFLQFAVDQFQVNSNMQLRPWQGHSRMIFWVELLFYDYNIYLIIVNIKQ